MKVRSLLTIVCVILITGFTAAQFYVGPHVGFKSSGLKGGFKVD